MDNEDEELALIGVDMLVAIKRYVVAYEAARGTIPLDDSPGTRALQARNAQQEEEDLAAATRASMEADYNERAKREAEQARRRQLEEAEELQHNTASPRKIKKKRGRPKAESCAVCHDSLGNNRKALATFPGCGHSQFHIGCAKKSYEATGRCPLCNLDKGVPFALK